jgi:hypothetical protein
MRSGVDPKHHCISNEMSSRPIGSIDNDARPICVAEAVVLGEPPFRGQSLAASSIRTLSIPARVATSVLELQVVF